MAIGNTIRLVKGFERVPNASTTGFGAISLIRLLAALCMLLFAAPALAEGVRVSLVDAGYGRSGSQILYGLKIDLDKGWHSYWISPGETGLPSRIETENRVNAGAADVLWPLPERFEVSGYETVGYRSSFVVPFTVPVDDASKETIFRLKGTIYACNDVCVPFPVDVTARTPPRFGDPAALQEIAPWLVRVPSDDPGGLEMLRAEVDGDDIVVEFSSPHMNGPDAFVDLGTRGFASLASMDVDRGVATARFRVISPRGGAGDATGALVVVSDGTGTVYRTEIVAPQFPAVTVLWTALLGGLVLNVMPCVFPVLAIKVFTLAAAPQSRRRSSYGATAAGIVCAFLVMAAVVAALKAAGHQTAWGMQFQQPVFLAVMAIVTAVFAANLAGAFEILLPSAVATRLHAVTGGEGTLAAFGQGFVLTLLATPCSAPFVGTAVGYALAGDVVAVLPVFAAMGFGMAVPYVVLAAFPSASRFLPRPGGWMAKARLALASAMAVSSGWLASLTLPTGWIWFFALCLAAAAASLVMSLRGVGLGAASVCAAAFLVVPALQHLPDRHQEGGIEWQAFDPVRLEALVREGRTVFVDISAEWCLTCKVNEKGVLASEKVRAMLQDGVVPMKGDWTRPNETIAQFLRSKGRYGIPFYLVAGPSSPEGVLLPELLTEDSMREAIAAAGRRDGS